MKIHDALAWRYAAKKLLSDKIIPPEKLAVILEAARKAPSPYNLQPWRLIVVANKPFQQQLQKLNNQEKIGQASHLIIFTALKQIDDEYIASLVKLTAKVRGQSLEELEKHSQTLKRFVVSKSPAEFSHWAREITFIALGFLLLAAAAEEIDAGPMTGFKTAEIDDFLGLTNTPYTSVVMVALGYRDPADKYSYLAKVRFDAADIIEKRA